MRVYCKSNLKYLFSVVLTALLLLTLTWKTYASHISANFFYSPLTTEQVIQQVDTVPKTRIQVTDTIPGIHVETLAITKGTSAAVSGKWREKRDSATVKQRRESRGPAQ